VAIAMLYTLFICTKSCQLY